MESHPIPAVRALILNNKGELLLIRSPQKWNGAFVLPGGRIKRFERIMEALEREVREEVGLQVEAKRFLDVQEQIVIESTEKEGYHLIFLNYLCSVLTTNVALDGVEAQEYIWLKPEIALQWNLEANTATLVRQFLGRDDAQ